MKRLTSFFITFLLIVIGSLQIAARDYSKVEVMIPMRDGISLHTEIYHPKDLREDLPLLITRSPYGQRHDQEGVHNYLGSSYQDLAYDGYIFVFQDIRGRYKSEGTFVMMRPSRNHSDPSSTDESTDTYDTIDWLIKNVQQHNGKVGILGISYGGWLAAMALVEPHPALTAASPQASPADMYLGDDFLHNGALRLSPAFGYAALMESAKTNAPFKYDQFDTYEFFLEMGPLKNGNEEYFKGALPSWNNFMNHPNYDEYWQALNVDHNLKDVPVPVLNVAGWWDAEDFYGPMKIYEVLEKYDREQHNYLVVGPWRHGGWARDQGDKLGAINFEKQTGVYFRKEIQAKWFAHFLKGKGAWDVEEAWTFRTGSNEWVGTQKWPPEKDIQLEKLFLHQDKSLNFSAPSSEPKPLNYLSDPDHPVPYSKRPIQGFWQHASSKALWKVEDQRFVDGRPDVMTLTSAPLKQDVTIAGPVHANLFASSTGTDCDWIVKLIDVYPEQTADRNELSGYQLMIADEVIRAKFREGFEQPKPLVPDEVAKYTIDLNSRHHTFLKGHQIMIQIQSTWFPLIDRNPQKFINIPEAEASDYQIADQKIYCSHQYPSHILLPIVDNEPRE